MHSCHAHSHVDTTTTQTLDETLFTAEHSLHHAVANDRLDRVEAILARGRDLDETDASGWAAILYTRSSAVLRVLLAAGADASVVTPAGRRTLLHRAVILPGDAGHAMVGLLLRHGLVDREDADGVTAHQLAEKLGKSRLAALLEADQS